MNNSKENVSNEFNDEEEINKSKNSDSNDNKNDKLTLNQLTNDLNNSTSTSSSTTWKDNNTSTTTANSNLNSVKKNSLKSSNLSNLASSTTAAILNKTSSFKLRPFIINRKYPKIIRENSTDTSLNKTLESVSSSSITNNDASQIKINVTNDNDSNNSNMKTIGALNNSKMTSKIKHELLLPSYTGKPSQSASSSAKNSNSSLLPPLPGQTFSNYHPVRRESFLYRPDNDHDISIAKLPVRSASIASEQYVYFINF